MAFTIDVAFGQAKDLERVEHELELALDVANQIVVSIRWVKEIVACRIRDFEIIEPNIEELHAGFCLVELLVCIFVVHDVLDLLEDLISVLDKVLLQSHSLGNDVAFFGLLAPFDLFLDQDIVFFALLLSFYQIATCANCIHIICLQQVIEGVEIEAFVEQLKVDLLSEAHEADSLVLDLGHQGLVVLVLGCDQLGDEVLSICLSDSL